jgi:hypothetical protein
VGEEAGSDLVGIASLTEQEMVFKAELEQAIGERDRGFCPRGCSRVWSEGKSEGKLLELELE